MKTNIEFTPANTLRHQYEFASCDPAVSPYPAIVGGYRSGKTFSIPLRWLWLIDYRARQGIKCQMFVIEPTYKMVRSVAVATFDKFFDQFGIRHRYHKTEHVYTIFYKKHSFNCMFVSAEKPENIVGFSMTDCIIDEFDVLSSMEWQADVYEKATARISEAPNPTIGIVTTPEGFRYTYELYQVKNQNNNKYRLIRAKTTDNHFLPQSYIDNLYEQYDSLLVQRYVNAEFVNLNNMAAYYMFDRDKHVKPTVKPDHVRSIVAGMDFNVDPMTACLGYFDGKNLPIFGEYFLRNSNTFAIIETMKQDWIGHAVCTYPDPSGSARKSSADISDIEIIKRAGFDCKFKHGLTQRRRLAYVNNWLEKGRIQIDPSCQNLIRDLEQVTTDSHGNINKPSGTMLTHISDALTNIVATTEINETAPQGRTL